METVVQVVTSIIIGVPVGMVIHSWIEMLGRRGS